VACDNVPVMKKKTVVTCPCGSGRKFARCCAPAGSARLQELVQEAIFWQEQGDPERALSRYQSILQNDKRNAPASYLCGTVYQQKGNFQRAIVFFERAFKLGLKDPAAKIQYVYALISAGTGDQAVKVLKKILVDEANSGTHTQARFLLANIYFESENFQQAEKHYSRLLDQSSDDWSLHFNLGHTLYHLAKIPEAIEQFKLAQSLNNSNAEIYSSLATMYQLDNNLDQARFNAEEALGLQEDNVSAAIVIARLLRGEKSYQQALTVLDKIDPIKLELGNQVLWWHEKGRVLDVLQQYKQAFEAFSHSRKALLNLRDITYDPAQIEQRLSVSEACFSMEEIEKSSVSIADEKKDKRLQLSKPQPLFIVGFYRSGTTLLEQMLSSHSAICGVGETQALAFAEEQLEALFGQSYPQCLKKNDIKKGNAKKMETNLQLLRAEYKQTIAQLDGYQQGANLVVDKCLFNMLRLPLINSMFPDSVVIHMVRHPLDVILSAYRTLFLERTEWSFTLCDIAHMYVRCHQHVQQMKGLLANQYYCLHYEKLVDEPEQELKTLFAFLGEAWDKSCLEFYRSERVARTASYEQVRKKLYKDSKFRYKYYLEFIDDEVIQILKPIIFEMGYQIEIEEAK
jgi:tetratricopeptide (TPR) repeat protein